MGGTHAQEAHREVSFATARVPTAIPQPHTHTTVISVFGPKQYTTHLERVAGAGECREGGDVARGSAETPVLRV